MVSAGGVKREFGALGPSNIILLSADRNGSTAFMDKLKTSTNLNGDFEIHLGECFSQDIAKEQPPSWWKPNEYKPSEAIKFLNYSTGKNVLLKLQITWPTFDKSLYEIEAKRKIFLHRNLFDSTLSRCIALQTGRWFTFTTDEPDPPQIEIDEEFFKIRLEYRIEKYLENLDYISNWCNEWHRYENIDYEGKPQTIRNPKKTSIVKNYKHLYKIFKNYKQIGVIEKEINLKIK